MSPWILDSPVELPDGSWVCGAHLLPICHICCCDYAYLQDSEYSDSDSDSYVVLHLEDSRKPAVGDDIGVMRSRQSGLDQSSRGDSNMMQTPIDFTPAVSFVPPNIKNTPDMLFSLDSTWRFSRHTNKRQILVYTDGACLNNGRHGAIGGSAFVYKGGASPDKIEQGIVSFRLENSGPTGIEYTHTSNRAELRAVIAVLQFRAWNDDGHNELVIATDSEYVEQGATTWIARWVMKGWRNCKGREIANRDLWQLLFKEMQKFKERQSRSRVMFWRIPRSLNTVADRAAKAAAATGEPQHEYTRI